MKCLAVLAILLFVDGEFDILHRLKYLLIELFVTTVALTSPITQHRWSLVPDSDGAMHLVDLNPMEMPVEPLFVPANDIAFLLFTRQNPTVAQRITFDLATVANSNFNPAHPTRFTMHGWQGGINSAVNVRVAEAYFQHGDYNVTVADQIVI